VAKANEFGGIEKIKKINRSYTVASKDGLSIENKYGTVEINTWDKNEFKVEITIKSTAESDANAQKQLDRVSINERRTGERIQFITEISNMGSNWGNKGDKRSLEINYMVFMPKNNP